MNLARQRSLRRERLGRRSLTQPSPLTAHGLSTCVPKDCENSQGSCMWAMSNMKEGRYYRSRFAADQIRGPVHRLHWHGLFQPKAGMSIGNPALTMHTGALSQGSPARCESLSRRAVLGKRGKAATHALPGRTLFSANANAFRSFLLLRFLSTTDHVTNHLPCDW